MILRLSSPAVRVFLVLLAMALAAGLSYSGIRNVLAVRDSGRNTLDGYQRATRLEPDDSSNWYLLGRYWQYNLEEPDARRAIRAYQTALSLDPRSADTWLDLGMAYETEGDAAAARNAFVQAKRAYPLSPEVSWRYGNFLLRRGELDAGFAEIKHALEADPKRGAAAFALSMRFDPDIHSVLERVVPRSEDAYLNIISALAEQGQTGEALMVWSKLADLPPHLPLGESFPLLEALLKKRQVAEAQRVWDEALSFARLPRPPDPPGSLVWDGGFETNVTGGGFAWRYLPFTAGVVLTLDTKEKHSGNRSLRLTFNGLENLAFHDVCQFVPVEPSTPYLFSAWVETRSLSTDQGVRFGLRSVEDPNNSVAWTEDVRGTQPWKKVELPWTSGKDIHELQLCVSRLPSAQFDSKIRGSAWIDDVVLVRASAESSSR
jgi:Tetratricopeptide repeat